MTRLSVSIMAHPARAGMVETLVQRLDREPVVAWDRRNDRWDTGERAWQAHDSSATHHLVLQDDAIPCRDLVAGLERALEHVPERSVVTAYLGHTRGTWNARIEKLAGEADAEGARFIKMHALFWGLAIVMPTRMVQTMLSWSNHHWRRGRARELPYDTRVGQFFLHHRLPVFCTHPSLVDHADAPSLLKHSRGRVAWRFIGEDVSALDVDWSGGHVRSPYR